MSLKIFMNGKEVIFIGNSSENLSDLAGAFNIVPQSSSFRREIKVDELESAYTTLCNHIKNLIPRRDSANHWGFRFITKEVLGQSLRLCINDETDNMIWVLNAVVQTIRKAVDMKEMFEIEWEE